jgi:hypothetical protein
MWKTERVEPRPDHRAEDAEEIAGGQRLRVTVERIEPVMVIWLDGAMTDGAQMEELTGCLDDRSTRRTVQEVVVDLTGVRSVDAVGIDAIAVLQHRAAHDGKLFSVRGAAGDVRIQLEGTPVPTET